MDASKVKSQAPVPPVSATKKTEQPKPQAQAKPQESPKPVQDSSSTRPTLNAQNQRIGANLSVTA